MAKKLSPEAYAQSRKEAGAKGGATRAKKLSPEERSKAAQHASKSRWVPLKAQYEGILELRGIKIPSAVLSDGTRVLTQKEFLLALGKGGRPEIAPTTEEELALQKLPVFLTAQNLTSFISSEIRHRSMPISYHNKTGEETWGYDATFLADVCDVYLDAQEAGVLRENQAHIAERCRVLMRGFAKIGIIALVDEATGYQKARSMQELRDRLNELLSEERQPYHKLIPPTFYEHMFRLRGWNWNKLDPARGPRRAADYTVDLIYKRLEQGLYRALCANNPLIEGDRDAYHHQHLKEEGRKAVIKMAHDATAIMRTFDPPRKQQEVKIIWRMFKRNIDRAYPKKEGDDRQEEMTFDAAYREAEETDITL